MSYKKFWVVLLASVSGLTAQTFLKNGVQRFAGVDTSHQRGDGGPAYYSTLAFPAGAAYDKAGNLYIAEQAYIRKVDTGGVITTIAGNGATEYKGDGGPATAAEVFYTSNITVDSKGNLYFVEDQVHIRRIATDGTISTFAGLFTNGYNGEGVPAASAGISAAGLAVDKLDQLYFADPQNARVRVVRQDGKVYTVAGTGRQGTAGENGPATQAQLMLPSGLAFDEAGNLYIADSRRVLRIDVNGTLTRAGGDPTLPLQAPGQDEVPATKTQVNAISVAVDGAGNILVGTPRVRRITSDGIIHAVAGMETPFVMNSSLACGDATRAIIYGAAMAVDHAGNIAIADPRLGGVEQVTAGGRITTIAGDGPNRFTGDGGAAISATFASPSAMRFDATGNLYIADTDNNRIRRVDANGTVRTVVGDGGPTYDVDAACVADQDSFLSKPQGIAFDAAGNLYIADSGKRRIRMLAADGTQSTVAGPPMLRHPVGVAVDGSGNLFVGDSALGAVVEIPASGMPAVVSTRGASGSMTFDAEGNLFIAAGYEADRLGTDGTLSPVAGTGEYSFSLAPGFTGSPIEIGNATSVAVDGGGSIYVADGLKGVIQRVSRNCALSLDGSASVVHPSGLAFDAQGNLYVADAVQGVIWQTLPVPPAQGELPTPKVGPNSIQSAAAVPLIQPFGEPPLPPYAGPVAPGELVKIRGVCLGPIAPVNGHFDANGMLPASVGGVQLTANGITAPLITVSSGELTAVAPYELNGGTSVQWGLTYGGVSTSWSSLIVAAAPAFFTQNGSGSGPAVVLNQDGSMNTQANAAKKGALVAFYVTGLGQTNPPSVDGLMATAPVPQAQLSVKVTIGSQDAQVMDAGTAPGLVGLSQVDVMVPPGLVGQGALPVTLAAGSFAGTQRNVTIWIAP